MNRFASALFALSIFAGSACAGSVVPVAPFNSIQLKGGGHVVLSQGSSQRVTLVKGSKQFTSFEVKAGQLEIRACNESCPQHYDLEIEIVAPRVDGVSVTGGGEIVAKGAFAHQAKLSAAVAGGGAIDVRTIGVDDANAAVTGGGEIHLAPKRNLKAAVTGGGEIAYSGTPKVTQAVIGGGSVERE